MLGGSESCLTQSQRSSLDYFCDGLQQGHLILVASPCFPSMTHKHLSLWELKVNSEACRIWGNYPVVNFIIQFFFPKRSFVNISVAFNCFICGFKAVTFRNLIAINAIFETKWPTQRSKSREHSCSLQLFINACSSDFTAVVQLITCNSVATTSTVINNDKFSKHERAKGSAVTGPLTLWCQQRDSTSRPEWKSLNSNKVNSTHHLWRYLGQRSLWPELGPSLSRSPWVWQLTGSTSPRWLITYQGTAAAYFFFNLM